ncbi:MAG TPA: ZIP family metal transporter [Pirellulaceae bacterium]|nr:ZIP family metal transporter [Pirellulaceae bacterium]
MNIAWVLLAYCILLIAASLAGGWLPLLTKLTHRWMQLAMSTVGGFMLGVALLHLVPHSFAVLGNLDLTVGWTLAGLLAMFLLIRVFHVHAHEHGDTGHEHDHEHEAKCDHPDHEHHPHPDPEHACTHDGTRERAGSGRHQFSWIGLALGLTLHSVIDGLALGAAVMADADEGNAPKGLALFGLGTFLAVVLHKPLDSLSITSLMMAGGWSRRSAVLANVVFAVICPLGAVGFVLGLNQLSSQQHVVVGCALAFAAGVFLCISLADLLPELTFHAHDRLPLTAALFVGVALAWAIGYFEPPHAHGPHERGPHDHREAEHGDHGH